MAEHHQDAHDALAPNGGTVQMLIRLGYATSPPAAPPLVLRFDVDFVCKRSEGDGVDSFCSNRRRNAPYCGCY